MLREEQEEREKTYDICLIVMIGQFLNEGQLQIIQIDSIGMAEAALFDLISHLHKARKTVTYLPPIMYIFNLVFHIIVYLSMPLLVNRIQPNSIIANITPVVISTGFVLLVAAEMIYYLVKKREFYLMHQLMLFRFVFSPLLTFSLLQTATAKQLPLAVALIILLFNKTLSSLLSRCLLYQAHRYYTLSIMQTSIVGEMAIFQTILIGNVFINTMPSQFIFAIATLALAVYRGWKHFIRLESEDIQYRILHLTNILHIVFSMFYVLIIIFSSLQPGYFFLSLLPFTAFACFTAYTKFKSSRDNLEKGLLSELSFSEFVESIDCFLILTREDYSRSKRRLVNYVHSIVSKHKAKCLLSGCELKNQSTEEELKAMTTKNMQQLIHKIMKKIEWILQGYHNKKSEDITISFALLKFYGEYYPNRMNMQNLINQINDHDLPWYLQCQLHRYRAICMGINNIDSIDVEKDQQIYLQFKNTMVSTLNCIIQFWREFNQEKVDLAKIMQIAAKLFPFKAKVDHIFNEQLEVQKFTAFKILKLYADYSHKILKKVEFAAKIQDFLSILGNWLRDKQDIQYLSKESQAGIIIICLSQSKLGDIFMANQRACDIFHYPRKQMLGLRVNSIMPSVFADAHDRILTDFLKKKRKKYNTDQRVLFGKDGNGYIFPVKLQLQRASYSSKDQYIFIASICPEKLRSAPIYCIVGHDGEITECTASFRNIFYSKSKKWSTSRSIQDIIPGYFDSDCSQKNTEVRFFTSFINNKKLGEIEAKFEISPIIVKSQHEGYLVKMTYQNQKTVSSYKNLRFTDNLFRSMMRKSVQGRQTHYNQAINSYQLQKIPHKIALNSPSPQFTLPFLNYEDMALFANSTQVKKYGKDIKTIRYVGNHYERIDQQQSFESELFENEDKVDMKTKIEELKHRFDHKEEKYITTIYKVLVNVIVVVTIAIAFSVYTIYQGEVTEQLQYLQNVDNQKQILYYLPQYVVGFTCAEAGINPSYYNQHIQQLKTIIINSTQISDISQKDKENIMKIIYLKSPANLANLFQSSAFALPESDVSVNATLTVMWGLMAGIAIAFVLLFALMFYHLNYAFLNIYTVFLSINDSSIKKIEDSCRWLIDQIYCTSQGNIDRDQEKKGDQEQDNQIEKMKQFKNNSRKQDLFVFIKIATPLLLIAAFLFIMLALSNSRFTLYLDLKQQHNILLDSIPASSIEFARLLLKVKNNLTLDIDNQYAFYYQQIEKNVLQFNNNTKKQLFLDVLYGNICINSDSVQPNMEISCKTLGNGILTTGITSTVNFIAEQLRNVALTNTMSSSTIDLLFSLQFLFINPALLSIQDAMQQILISEIKDFGSLFSWMLLLLVCLFIGFDVYLFWFPFRTIDEQIKLTNEMISLMPDSSAVEPST